MDDAGSALTGCEVHLRTADATGRRYKVVVGGCPDPSARPEGVVVVTDADLMVGTTVDVVRGMQLMDHLPPLLVVGVGYPVGAVADTLGVRMRDLTPWPDERYAAEFPVPDGVGGAGAFLDFLTGDLLPWVGGRFGAPTAGATYVGHSLGGLFGAWALLTRPTAFGRWVLGSPSIWWAERALLAVEEAYAATHTDLVARVFVGVGADETVAGRAREMSRLPRAVQDRLTWPIDLVADADRLVTALRGRHYPGLVLDHQVFEEEFHVTVAPSVISRGLRHVHGAPR